MIKVLLLTTLLSIVLGQDDLETRVAKLEEATRKLEELAKMGTLRSCAEYSRFGVKKDGFYQVDPDGPLLGQLPFKVFCNFTTGHKNCCFI